MQAEILIALGYVETQPSAEELVEKLYKRFCDRLLDKLAENVPESPYDCDHIGAVEEALGLQ